MKLLFLVLAFTIDLAFTEELYPGALLQLESYFSHHVLVAEKSVHKLHLFKNDNGHPKLVKTYKMATGKKTGDKLFQGDHRTPEGIYYFTEFIPRKVLIERHGKEGEIYGVGAFVMDYPNPIDRKLKKTGGGIWLHSTNEETRIEKGLDSRGCLVIANNDLKDVSHYLELNRSSVVVVHELNYLRKNVWETKKKELKELITSWIDAWKNERFEKYISHYHPKEFFDARKGYFKNFYRYKKEIFRRPGAPHIEISNLNITAGKDYVVATFKQLYKSKTINDTGHKKLYLKKDQY
ncbi:MAG: L,D-transpeptidase family protein, partial [Halobacteriovoraceae bacterium]|nr:L,D-transpeptidase family protein [Halobacteriovoraceae bacterium]